MKVGSRPAPKSAIEYWNLSSDATLRDVVIAVRADEARHRDTNHSFADELTNPSTAANDTHQGDFTNSPPQEQARKAS